MQSPLSPAQITVLSVACSLVNCDRFEQWLANHSRYRWLRWESDDSLALDSTCPPDLILLGCRAGVESLTALAAQWPTARVIVILEPEQAAEAELWLNQGADDFWVSTQISEVRFLHTLQRLVAQSQEVAHRIATRTPKLGHAKRAAEMASHVNHQLMTDLSHDLRTPLSTILGFSQLLLQEANLTPQQQDALNIIYTSGEHLLGQINSTLAITQPAPVTPLARSPQAVVGLAPGSPVCRILIVDDDWISRVLLQTLLAPLGFELQVATSGRDAIIQWADWQPHLICIAMAMTGLDGYETTRHLTHHRVQTALPRDTPSAVCCYSNHCPGKQ
ncbi:response regulator [Nodosilinea sp. LEGE 07298]|uniref:ATP-binding response regulator n=1 Tax=Nodosilinea sp. LEGE 07298 TaxID=2777970 RepID=UPI001880266D|nr:histidine kinase dimerization/phospho-acceptor domain-containing protein [Nodosilinea sp. LEGE 07298]MBE9110933.1 response regulator [Nodosilinea sp. LEGE 07298]